MEKNQKEFVIYYAEFMRRTELICVSGNLETSSHKHEKTQHSVWGFLIFPLSTLTGNYIERDKEDK